MGATVIGDGRKLPLGEDGVSIKPEEWPVEVGLVEPEWEFWWDTVFSAVAMWGGDIPYDLVQRVPWTLDDVFGGGLPTFIDTKDGRALDMPDVGGAGGFITSPTLAHGIGSDPYTICYYGTVRRETGTYQSICGTNSFAPGIYTALGGTAWGMYDSGDQSSGHTFTIDTDFVVRLVVRRTGTGAGGLTFWRNGIIEGSTGTNAGSMADGAWEIGSNGGGGSELGNVTLLFWSLHTEAWTDEQIIKWSLDPYGPIRMVDEAVFFVPAGGDTAMVAAQGSYTLTGQAATTTKDTPVTATQGSYALTGKDAITSQTKSIPADQGAYSLTGKDANTLWGHAFAAAQGSYALTGKDAIVSRQIAIAAVQGAYTLTGKDAILSRTKSIPADQGAYALTGKDAGTRVGQTLTAVQGAYTLTGKAADLLFDHLIAAVQGSYALTGQSAVTTKDSPMTAAQGAYALTGQASNLLWGHLIAAVQGSYALSGQAAVLSRQITITAAQGSYALTGQPAVISRQITIVGAQGSYALTGQAANLLWGHALTAAQGSYALNGQDALIFEGPRLVAVQGAYVLNGQAVVFVVVGDAPAARILRVNPMMVTVGKMMNR